MTGEALTAPGTFAQRSDRDRAGAAEHGDSGGGEVLQVGDRGVPEGSAFEEIWPEIEGLETDDLAPEHIAEATTARREDTGVAIVAFTFQTMRCVMTTLARPGLPDDRDDLRTVAKHNRIQIDKPEVAGRWACAGAYADVTTSGELAVGDGHDQP